MVSGVLGDQRHFGDAGDCVGVRLQILIPEILRMLMRACEEADIRHRPGACKRERKAHTRGIAICALASPLEMEWLIIAHAQFVERVRIRLRVGAGERDHRRALAGLHKIMHEGRERKGARIGVNWRVIRCGRADQFKKGVRKLDDVVLRAPGVRIARANPKTHVTKDFRLGLEIARRQNDMVQSA